MASRVRVLVVDDSALMRREIRRLIEEDPLLEVVGAARNGQEAVDLNRTLEPDVITMDINMPVMDGLTAVQYIMMEQPRPIIMLSSLTQDGAVTSFEALELGAVDFVPKPGGTVSQNIAEVAELLRSRIKSAAVTNLTASAAARKRRKQQGDARARATEREVVKKALCSDANDLSQIVVIGQSTGGPNTIMEVLPAIPKNFPAPILIVQHMPASFTPTFAERLNRSCAIPFKEAANGDVLQAGHGYVAPGDFHLVLAPGPKGSGKIFLRTTKIPADTLHKPSVDVTMESVLEYFPGANIVAAILTGMGSDGAAALAKIRKAGGRTIAESEETAIVFGMPKEAIRMGGAEFVLPASTVGAKLVELVEIGLKGVKNDN